MTLVPAYVRAQGEVRANFVRLRDRTHLDHLHEAGGLRLRFPKSASSLEAVLVNTAGGVAGGDRADLRFELDRGARAAITTQSAEKIYRSQGPESAIDVRLDVGAAAHLDWLPQETILFDGARLSRRLHAGIADDASITIAESVVFGRAAMGETRPRGLFRDRWRIRRGGRLVFADDVRLDGDLAAVLDRQACGAGARAIATLLHVGRDAEQGVDRLRESLNSADLAATDFAGASAWNGMLLVRIASASPTRVRAALAAALIVFRGCQMPRVWQ